MIAAHIVWAPSGPPALLNRHPCRFALAGSAPEERKAFFATNAARHSSSVRFESIPSEKAKDRSAKANRSFGAPPVGLEPTT